VQITKLDALTPNPSPNFGRGEREKGEKREENTENSSGLKKC